MPDAGSWPYNFMLSQPPLAVQGDSAFGFGAMELETACRYKLPITFIIINNNGIYRGLEELPATREDNNMIPVLSLSVKAKYESIAEAFGGKGFFVETPDQLRRVRCLCSSLGCGPQPHGL